MQSIWGPDRRLVWALIDASPVPGLLGAQYPSPRAPCSCMVDAWDSKGRLYPEVRTDVLTCRVLGAFG